MQRRETIELNGIVYTRWPDASHRDRRVYFRAPRGRSHGLYHRDLWQAAYGPIPAGHHIHHADHNPLNNALENLVCLTPAEHAKAHPEVAGMSREHMAAIQPLAVEWHHSAEGMAWHREHGKASWVDRVSVADICDECGESYQTFTPARARPHYCSRRCSRRVADRAHRYEQQVACPICGALFWQSRSKVYPTTCSHHCGQLLSWRRRASL